jgi:hypothetical protein
VESPDQEWLKTPEGRDWLETDAGMEWWRSTEGQWWSRSEDAESWYDELAQRGWAAYFAGERPDPPEWAITPVTAPRIGSWVRMTNTGTTFGGITFEKGELAIVSEIHFVPMGVRLRLRTADGRTRFAMSTGEYELA